jgi:hypothetical protein
VKAIKMLRSIFTLRPFIRSNVQLSVNNSVSYGASTFTTYSGGQASEGQGGFYSAIRKNAEKPGFQPGSRAEKADLEKLDQLMQKASDLKEIAKEPTTKDLLARLHVKGAPVWGLSVEQREFLNKLKASA